MAKQTPFQKIESVLAKNRNGLTIQQIVDTSCGSGSFLLRAFDSLVNYETRKTKGRRKTLQAKFDDNQLGSILKRKTEILKNAMYGVDLDAKAVEITRLNLLLKLAEKRHRLPTLKENIRCGNSLIDSSEIAGLDAFKWDEEFGKIINQGGFDAVIGNPPYIRNTDLSKVDKEFYSKEYISAFKQYDIYILFFELGIKLLKDQGYLGFITSNKYIASDYGRELRDYILNNCKIISLVDVSHMKVFKDASTYPVITILQKVKSEKARRNHEIKFQKISDIADLNSESNVKLIKQSEFMKNEDNRFLEYKGDDKYKIIKKIEEDTIKIKDVFNCKRGSPKNKISIVDNKSKNSLNCIVSKDVKAYLPEVANNLFVISDKQNEEFSKEKILIPRTVLDLRAAYEAGNNFIMDRIYYLTLKENADINLKFVTGLLNSKLMDFYYKTNFESTHVGGGYLDLRGVQISSLPIKMGSDEIRNSIAKCVDRIISLKIQYGSEKNKKTNIGQKLEKELGKLNNELNDLVFRLYGLTNKERLIIENHLDN